MYMYIMQILNISQNSSFVIVSDDFVFDVLYYHSRAHCESWNIFLVKSITERVFKFLFIVYF